MGCQVVRVCVCMRVCASVCFVYVRAACMIGSNNIFYCVREVGSVSECVCAKMLVCVCV